MSSAQEAVAALVNDMVGDETGAPDTGEQPAPDVQDAPQPVETPVEMPAWEADTDGIEELLDGPDDDDEIEDPDDDEPVLVQQDDEYVDPEVARLRAKVAKQQKENKYLRELRSKDNEKTWRAEASRRFPLADVEEIHAQSKRSFLRQAASQHERVERKIQPIIQALESLKTEVVTEAKTEARQEARQAWGQPQTGPTSPMVESAETEVVLDRKKYRTVHDMVRARFSAGLEI